MRVAFFVAIHSSAVYIPQLKRKRVPDLKLDGIFTIRGPKKNPLFFSFVDNCEKHAVRCCRFIQMCGDFDSFKRSNFCNFQAKKIDFSKMNFDEWADFSDDWNTLYYEVSLMCFALITWSIFFPFIFCFLGRRIIFTCLNDLYYLVSKILCLAQYPGSISLINLFAINRVKTILYFNGLYSVEWFNFLSFIESYFKLLWKRLYEFQSTYLSIFSFCAPSWL